VNHLGQTNMVLRTVAVNAVRREFGLCEICVLQGAISCL